jgi:hypothetical protein
MTSDFDNVLNTVLVPLSSSDRSKRAAASAAVAMLLTQAPPNSKLSSKVLPAINPLLNSDDCLAQVQFLDCYCRRVLEPTSSGPALESVNEAPLRRGTLAQPL